MTNSQITPEAVARNMGGSFPGQLGIEPVELQDGLVTGRLLVDRRHLHPGGYVHGGVWVAFADSVAAWGTMRQLAPGENFTTVGEFDAETLGPYAAVVDVIE